MSSGAGWASFESSSTAAAAVKPEGAEGFSRDARGRSGCHAAMQATPLFAGTELAARIEGAEVDLTRAGAEARPPGDPAYARPLAGGIAVHTIEGSPLNKVIGLGFDGPLEEGAVAEVEAELKARGAGFVQVELATLADPDVGGLLTGRGYRLMGFENVLGRALPAELATPPAIAVAPDPAAGLDAWIDVVVTGFASPDTQGVASREDFPRDVLDGVMRELAATRGFERYVAHREGQLAGGASMRTHAGVAQLTGAAVLPVHRRRGVQTALLAHRLHAAASRGCDVAVVTTQPGSKSQANVQKLGFHLLYARAILVREL